MSDRDTSGLWDKSQVGTPDRTVPIAPPPRPPKKEPLVDTEKPTPLASVQEPPRREPDETLGRYEGRPRDSSLAEPSGPMLLALAFTSDQMDWIRKTSTRRGQWAGEFFEALFLKHKLDVAARGVGARTRRRNSNYTGTRVKVSAETFRAFDALVAELDTSRAALGRVIVDAERIPSAK